MFWGLLSPGIGDRLASVDGPEAPRISIFYLMQNGVLLLVISQILLLFSWVWGQTELSSQCKYPSAEVCGRMTPKGVGFWLS